MRPATAIAIIFSGLVLITLFIFLWPAKEINKICEKDKETQQEECSQYSAFPFVLVKIVKALDHHEGAVLGLGTIAVAFFTFGLWLSTSDLWKEATAASKIAKQSADIAFTTAMPILTPYVTDMSHIHSLTKVVITGQRWSTLLPDKFHYLFHFR